MTIAVVTNYPPALKLISHLLTFKGYHTVSFSDVEAAYSMVREDLPQLVVLDIEFGDRRAWNLLDLLLLDPATKDIPALVCSGDLELLQQKAPRLRKKGYAWLEKPFDLDELLGKIGKLIGPPPNTETKNN